MIPLHLLVEVGFMPLTLVLLVLMIHILPKIEKIGLILQRLEALEKILNEIVKVSVKKSEP